MSGQCCQLAKKLGFKKRLDSLTKTVTVYRLIHCTKGKKAFLWLPNFLSFFKFSSKPSCRALATLYAGSLFSVGQTVEVSGRHGLFWKARTHKNNITKDDCAFFHRDSGKNEGVK
jgi:hypothetical protein